MNHRGKAIDILDQESAALAFNDAKTRKPIELAGDGLAMRADAARDLNVRGCRGDAGGLALAGS
jgi:hypothetical protein